MTVADFQRLYAYNRWANQRVLDSAAQLSIEEYQRDLGSSFSSVRDTLVHMLSAEWIWLMRCNGTSPARMLDPGDYPTLEELRARWRPVEDAQQDFLARLDEAGLSRRVAYTNTKGEPWAYPLAEMLLHVVNHASYHRGQIATILRQVGRVPASTDLLLYRDEAPAG